MKYVAYREVWVTVERGKHHRVEPRIIHAYGDTQEEADQKAARWAAEIEEEERRERSDAVK